MPFYSYKCPKCKKEKDVLQKMDDKKTPICDGVEIERIYKPNAKPASKDGSWGLVNDYIRLDKSNTCKENSLE